MYPHTIDNGHGERITFLGRHGDRLLVSSEVAPGAVPPMHTHWQQTETLPVESGLMGVAMPGVADRFFKPGELVSFSPGVEHRFWNAGDEPLRCVGEIHPALNVEYFLSEVFSSTARNAGRPDAFDGAFLLTRYRSEFALTAIPASRPASYCRSRPGSDAF